MTSASSVMAGLLALVVLVPAAAIAGEKSSRCGAVKRPAPASYCPVRLIAPAPRRHRVRPHGTVTSWLEKEHAITAEMRDPWRAELWGAKTGDTLRVRVQEPSAPLELAGGCGGQHSRGAELTAMLRGGKQALRRGLRRALRFSTLREFKDVRVPEVSFDSFGKVKATPPLVLEGQEELPVHTPVVISRQRRGGAVPLLITNARGRRYEERHVPANEIVPGTRQRIVERVYIKSGEENQHYEPWVTRENLFVTPAYRAAGGGRGTAALLGLAAFPIGATVRVTNVDMKAHGMKGHTVTAAPKKRTGSLRLALPAPTDGAEYLMEVAFAGRAKRSKSKILSYRFRLPSSASSDVQTHGLGYYRANLYDGLSQTRTHLNQHFQKVDSYQPVD